MGLGILALCFNREKEAKLPPLAQPRVAVTPKALFLFPRAEYLYQTDMGEQKDKIAELGSHEQKVPSTISASMASDIHVNRELSTWNQVAMRTYVRQVFCFPLNEHLDDFNELCTRIKLGLALACSRFPHFAGKIVLGPCVTQGAVYVSTTANDVVSFKFFDNRQDSSFGWSYPELKAQGFPCKAFVGPWFGLPYNLTEGGPGVPVTEVHARIVRGGGLLLCVYIHHSISDGIGMCNFISTFASYTLQLESDVGHVDMEYPANIDVDIPCHKTAALIKGSSFEELMEKCPEYTILPQLTGPTAPCTRQDWVPALGDVPKTGRIFKFNQDKISMLKSMAQGWAKGNVIFSKGTYPSTFACLAAVTWSFCTVARLASQPHQATNNNTHDDKKGVSTDDMSHLLIPASWRRRAFKDSLDGYASNAVCMSRIYASVDSHFVIGDGASSTASPATAAANKADELGKLICFIDSSITAIDEKGVATRTAMFRAARDPRMVGVNLDPQDPRDFIVNSWRHLGGDIAFDLPGVKAENESGTRARAADAVRRAQPVWNMGAGLVLPGKFPDSDYEILVTLDEASMERLLGNSEWMSWVSETIE